MRPMKRLLASALSRRGSERRTDGSWGEALERPGRALVDREPRDGPIGRVFAVTEPRGGGVGLVVLPTR